MDRNYRHTELSRRINLKVSPETHLDEIEAALVATLDCFDGDGKVVGVYFRLQDRYLDEGKPE